MSKAEGARYPARPKDRQMSLKRTEFEWESLLSIAQKLSRLLRSVRSVMVVRILLPEDFGTAAMFRITTCDPYVAYPLVVKHSFSSYRYGHAVRLIAERGFEGLKVGKLRGRSE